MNNLSAGHVESGRGSGRVLLLGSGTCPAICAAGNRSDWPQNFMTTPTKIHVLNYGSTALILAIPFSPFAIGAACLGVYLACQLIVVVCTLRYWKKRDAETDAYVAKRKQEARDALLARLRQ